MAYIVGIILGTLARFALFTGQVFLAIQIIKYIGWSI